MIKCSSSAPCVIVEERQKHSGLQRAMATAVRKKKCSSSKPPLKAKIVKNYTDRPHHLQVFLEENKNLCLLSTVKTISQ